MLSSSFAQPDRNATANPFSKVIQHNGLVAIADQTGLNSSAEKQKENFVDSPKEIVRSFLDEVRSGAHPEKAVVYMADTVLAHQVTSEIPVTVKRTPANYTAHVKEFLTLLGKFEFSITELLADGNKVYAKWVQKGIHLQDIDQYKATGLPLVEYTSAVYKVENGKITEYWLQTDRFGFDEQLKKNALLAAGNAAKKIEEN